MPITPDELSTLYPKLYHVSFASNVASVLQSGLKCAAALKIEAGLKSEQRPEARLRSTPLQEGVTLNDQLPMCGNVWRKCRLPDGMSEPSKWFRYLDQHIFFWTTEERLAIFLKTRRKLRYESVVFQVDTLALLQAFEPQEILLSEQNTGGPYAPNPTPRVRFASFEAFLFLEVAKLRRSRKEAIVEVVLHVPMNRPELLTLMPQETWPN